MKLENTLEYVVNKLSTLLDVDNLDVSRLITISYYIGQLDLLSTPDIEELYNTQWLKEDIEKTLNLMNYDVSKN